jgi:hypothetical protein
LGSACQGVKVPGACFQGAASSGVAGEQRFELGKEVVLGAEVAEVAVARALGFGLAQFHFLAVVAVEAVAFDDGGGDAFAAEDVLEGAGDRGGSRARRAGDGDDGVALRHGDVPWS